MQDDEIDWRPVTDWFGRKIRFHDCEVVSIDLRRDPEPCVIAVHAFVMTPEMDEDGYYILDKHALVWFRLNGIEEQDLIEWNFQNALDSLEVSRVEQGYRLNLEGAYGVGGHFTARAISISLQPVPEGDIGRTLVAGSSRRRKKMSR